MSATVFCCNRLPYGVLNRAGKLVREAEVFKVFKKLQNLKSLIVGFLGFYLLLD